MKNDNNLEEAFNKLNNDTKWIKDRTIFITVHGSCAYGLNTPESDIDLRGVCVAPKEYYIGYNKTFNEYIANKPDCTIFDILKFFKLASQNNPNCLEILFTEQEHHLIITKAGQKLLDNRDQFLSKALKERFIGYAKSQAHRIRQHKKWLLSGIKMEHKPTRQEMGLPEKPEISQAEYDAVKSAIVKKIETWNPHFEPFSEAQQIFIQNKIGDILSEMQISSNDKWAAASRLIGLNDNLIRIIQQERAFENKLEEWRSFCEWKKNRNPKRAAMEEKYGYDLKHATQLVRLLRLGKEILETGKVQVYRIDDREELLAIKNGAWSYAKLTDYADKIEEELKETYKNSKLPNQPNVKLLDNLCIEIIESML